MNFKKVLSVLILSAFSYLNYAHTAQISLEDRIALLEKRITFLESPYVTLPRTDSFGTLIATTYIHAYASPPEYLNGSSVATGQLSGFDRGEELLVNFTTTTSSGEVWANASAFRGKEYGVHTAWVYVGKPKEKIRRFKVKIEKPNG